LKENLVPRSEIAEQWSLRVGEICSGLELFQSRIVAMLPDNVRSEIATRIKAEIRALREAYARGGRYCPRPKEQKP